MNENDQKILEFYKSQYEQENDRTRYYDTIIQYPTTLIVFLIGGTVFAFNKYFPDGFINIFSTKDWIFIVLLGLFAISIIITTAFLFYVFHGFTRKYGVLPFILDLSEYEKELFIYNYRYNSESSRDKRFQFAQKQTCLDFINSLKEYYIRLTNDNQIINDKRAVFYHRTRAWLFADLILFLLIAIIGFTK
jgi:hypothetical protein